MGKITVVLDQDVDNALRALNRHHGDMSKIINTALRTHFMALAVKEAK